MYRRETKEDLPMETVKTNRQYKSSVFTALFSEKENLLELYNAIENTNYGKDITRSLPRGARC